MGKHSLYKNASKKRKWPVDKFTQVGKRVICEPYNSHKKIKDGSYVTHSEKVEAGIIISYVPLVICFLGHKKIGEFLKH
jgi:hypothetical protein